jgi:hypothetical protein
MTKKERKQLDKYMKTAIYFVTCLNPILVNGKYRGDSHTRCWGWYRKPEDATQSVLENHNDIYEIEFTYAVIEKYPEGTVPIYVEEMAWFKWDETKRAAPGKGYGAYKKCRKPAWSKGIINWAY